MTGAGEPHARLRGVTRTFAGVAGAEPVHALGPIDLDLQAGEFFSVVGPSGCGKSTLLDLVAGLSAPDQGTVTFEGRPVTGVPDGVGIVFQEDASFPWLTVHDNAAFGLRRAGMVETEVLERVTHALSFMGLAGFARAYPAQLSGGMRQRLCIARTLVMRPRLLLLDEPFGAVDELTRRRLNIELPPLWSGATTTTVLVTHSIDEAVLLADRVLVMSPRPGRIIADLPVDLDRPRRLGQLHSARFTELVERIGALLGVDQYVEDGA